MTRKASPREIQETLGDLRFAMHSRVISRVRVTPRELKGYLLAASIMA
jgi:hypothetical protein